MDAYCITIKGHEGSEEQAAICRQSIEDTGNDRWLTFNTFQASTPKSERAEYLLRGLDCNKDLPTKRACAMSHYRLWEKCAAGHDTIIVLEHDAVFVNELTRQDMMMLTECPFGAIALYWPGGYNIYQPTTRTKGVIGCEKGVMAKGYMLKPEAAKLLINIVKRDGTLKQNDTYKFNEFPLQAGFYKNVVDDAVYLDRNLRTSHGL